ncbi:putative alginate O-acetyltransferase AlgI [Leptospira weilii serovar Ranarum str. ICFT]|uniref:Alginate O-acetyltransferase AlgI n=1 Tax=Leptospira weilii serovar Ranarum str. ICFT TaxID=1218598 RepID=N1WMZ2_9LEPT|nr:MBOAT family O-acyltransferase [Leptospira weilii]EMY78484.1 putative alginate O-acetyltransferase AlgI [Leptospira weilii serovar Ranarum str. ICFT]
MIFTSTLFLLFFLCVYVLYWAYNGRKYREWVIVIASLVFYATWSVPFLFHLLAILYINYWAIRSLFKKKSLGVLRTIVVLDLINLGVFKYFYFFTDNFYAFTGWGFLDQKTFGFQIILPLAISFYTFQIIAFVVDVYRGKITEDCGPFRFILFILFFPQLVAGPIMRHQDFFPILDKVRIKPSYVYAGLYLLGLGIAKKILVADNIASLVDPVYRNPTEYDGYSLFLAAQGFTWQVYCDFSGYTDIARGCAFLMGFNIPVNFRAPFFSQNVQDLWRRWHVTLATWLRDYIYIPLGGSRTSEPRIYLNLIATFTLGGFWHGASWTYVVWGFWHGLCLVIDRLMDRLKIPKLPEKGFFWWLVRAFFVYSIFMIGAVFFRSQSVTEAWYILFYGVQWIAEPAKSILRTDLLIPFLMGAILLHTLEYFEKVPRFYFKYQKILISVFLILLVLLLSNYAGKSQDFIYFQF